jgi:hypothetical protein
MRRRKTGFWSFQPSFPTVSALPHDHSSHNDEIQ